MVIFPLIVNFLVAQGTHLQQLQLTGLPWLNMSPYAKPKSREIGLKRSVICMRISLKLTQRRQVGRSRGKKGTFSLRKLPHKKRDVAKTQANSYVAPCIFSP